jgi:ribosomal-protein-alanine N-acetyltransferase
MLLVAVGHADRDALLAFELANRTFFEASVKPRAAAYYSQEGVTQAIRGALADAAAGRGYQFLVKSGQGDILGRINLRDVAPERGSAVLGYRIGAAHLRQGHASAAVAALLAIAFGELGLRSIVAGARATNPGSIEVLRRNGFTRLAGRDDTVEQNGMVHAHWYFERRNEAPHFAPANGMSRHP